MIKSKRDYIYYLKLDATALSKSSIGLRERLIDIVFPDYIWKFQKQLRKLEYLKNCRNDVIGKITYLILKYRFRKLSIKLGFTIPENVFGPGLAIIHYGTIVVNAKAKVGKNCRIHPSTCIGASGGENKAPTIGDNVYIAPGVKMYGDIRIANNIATAANAAIGTSFEEENILIGGVPARKIKSIDIKKIIKHLG